MTIYLGNWASLADYECARDDGPDCVEDLAWPKGIILESNDAENVKALLDMAWADCAELWEEDEDSPLPDPDWEVQEGLDHCQKWWSSTFECLVVLVPREFKKPAGGPA